jgi:hypothetical protein
MSAARPPTEPSNTADDADVPIIDLGFLADPGFWRLGQVETSAVAAATTIVLALLLWMIVSFVSAVPLDVLKRRAVIFAWIALPSAPVVLTRLFIDTYLLPGGAIGIIPIMWTDVFTALAIGAALKRLLFPASKAPEIRSLPLAALVFCVLTSGALLLFIEHGIVRHFITCEDRSLPFSLFSECDLLIREGFYCTVFATCMLIVCGIALSPDSNLIRAYNMLRVTRRGTQVAPGVKHSAMPPEPAYMGPLNEAPTQGNGLDTNASSEALNRRAIKKAFTNRRQEFDI